MPGSCGTCSSILSRTNPGISCQGSCRKEYHLRCVKLPTAIAELPADSGLGWRCRNCKETADSGGVLHDMNNKIDLMLTDMSDIKRKQQDFADSLKFYGDKIDDFNQQMEDLKNLSKSIKGFEQELLSVRSECARLKNQIEYLNQQERANNIEICGMPEKRGENIIEIVKTMGNVIGASISSDDIVAAHRVARFQKGGSPVPKNIVVKFSSVIRKREILAAAKGRRNPGLNGADVGFNQDVKIFVNEHLSPYYKLLHKKAREFCKTAHYKYCWIKDMKIFIKKTDESRAVLVDDEMILSRLG